MTAPMTKASAVRRFRNAKLHPMLRSALARTDVAVLIRWATEDKEQPGNAERKARDLLGWTGRYPWNQQTGHSDG